MSGNFWGELIKRLREEQGVTQRRLAFEAKVNRSTLRHIERGVKPGDVDILERLLDYLGYELDAIEVRSMSQDDNSPCNSPVQ